MNPIKGEPLYLVEIQDGVEKQRIGPVDVTVTDTEVKVHNDVWVTAGQFVKLEVALVREDGERLFVWDATPAVVDDRVHIPTIQLS